MRFKPTFSNQKGQATIAMAIVLIAILALALNLVTHFRNLIKEDQYTRQYREAALSMAQAGFADAQAWFTRQTSAVSYVPSTSTSGPWSQYYPDWAFKPKYNSAKRYSDTDLDPATDAAYGNFNSSYGYDLNGNTIASAIVHTEALHLTSSANNFQNIIWGRWVVKRQATRNWSPGSNTFSAYSDPAAVHDLTSAKTALSIGAGNIWGITSSGYIYSSPYQIDASPTAFTGNNVLNPPLRLFLGKPLLLASATYYGELVTLPYQDNNAAIMVYNGANVSILANSKVSVIAQNATSNYGVRSGDGGTPSGTSQITATTIYSTGSKNLAPGGSPSPSVSNVFPGYSWADLKNLASVSSDPSQPDPTLVFPDPTQSNYLAQVTKGTYYCLNGNATFQTRPSSSSTNRVLEGSGLLVVDGNLTVQQNNVASWTGIIIVNGNINIADPFNLSGSLICVKQGATITIGSGTPNNTIQITYDPKFIQNVSQFFAGYRLNKASVQYSTH